LPVGSKVPVENFKINDAMPEITTGQFTLPAIFISLLFLASIPFIASLLNLDFKIVFRAAHLIFTGKNNSPVLMKIEQSAGFSPCYIYK
jgi:hypothetical protein